MKAMILAAGKGTRVRPVTNRIPKPMVPIVHKPVLEHIVEHLRDHGFDEIVVNTSHLAPQIEDYFRDGSRFGVSMAYSFEGWIDDEGALHGEALGSAGGLRRIQDHSGFFDSTFLVMCGDAMIDLDLGKLVEEHRSREALASIALTEVPADKVESYGIVVTDDEGRIQEFQEKPSPADARSTTANTGIYLFEPEIFTRIPARQPFDIGGELFPALVEEGARFFGSTIPFQWVDIGTVGDYLRAVLAALEGGIRNFHPSGREVGPGVRFGANVNGDLRHSAVKGPVWVGGSATLEPGCTIIGPAVIGAGSIIKSGARIERSVVLDHTRVGPAAQLKDNIVCGDFCVGAEGHAIEVRKAGVEWVLADARRRSIDVPDDARDVARLHNYYV